MSLHNQQYRTILAKTVTNGRNPYSPKSAVKKNNIEDSTEFSCGSSIEKSPKSFNTECSRKFRDVHVFMAVSSCVLGSVFGDTVYGA